MLSLPLRERGLKSMIGHPWSDKIMVAPFTGAWIEISTDLQAEVESWRRSLYGSVD